MPHDKIRAAARERMATTGEPYTAARRAALGEHRGAGPVGQRPAPGYALGMPDEIHGWLADLRGRDAPAALRVAKAVATLMTEGERLGNPLVEPTAGSWPWALLQALDRSYQERLERLERLRRREADAASLVIDLQDQAAELQALQARLAGMRRRAVAGRSQPEAAQAAAQLAAIQKQAAGARRLLAKMTEASSQLRTRSQQLQARVEAARARKEVLKASYVAAHGALRAREAMAALGQADDDPGQRDAGDEAISAAQARLAEVTRQLEREVGQQARPDGLMQLTPGAPWHDGIRILFAAEPPGTALLIAVLEGPEAVADQYPEALMASADVLSRVRAGQAPEAATHVYDGPREFLEEFYPATAGVRPARPDPQRPPARRPGTG